MVPGSLVLPILLHVPYVRRAGVWPFGESQLFTAIADAFLPLLEGIEDLQREGLAPRFTVALSPVLAEQLADPLLCMGFEAFMVRRLEALEDDARTLRAPLADLARWQHERCSHLLDLWSGVFKRDLVWALRNFERDGAIEMITAPATAAVLPLLPRGRMAALQVHMGLVSAERHLEHRPDGFWLPGGAIAPRGALQPMFEKDNWNRPMYRHGEEVERPGTDELLRRAGLSYAFVGENALHGGRRSDRSRLSALDPHLTQQGLALLACHDSLPGIWLDPIKGFPSHSAYLAPADGLGHRYLGRGPGAGEMHLASGGDIALTVAPDGASDGLQGLQAGQLYRPDLAAATARAQAEQAVASAGALLEAHWERTGRSGVVVVPLDARLFMNWIEGPRWACEVVRAAAQAGLPVVSGAEAVHRHEPIALDALHPASWEAGGDFRVWRAPNTTWYWEVVSTVLETAESLEERFAALPHPVVVRTLAQAFREAFLLVSGDWPRMIGAGGDERDYAAERVRGHHDRFRLLAEMLATEDFGENFDVALLERFEALDNPFPAMDYDVDRPGGGDQDDFMESPWTSTGPGGVV